MPRPKLEAADIFRTHGSAYRRANAGHLNLSQLRVMSAIEACRTEALGGHVAVCTKCNHQHIAYNSCKNRHCPKCQAPAARDWMPARAEDLLPVEYFHVVFTLPAEIARIALWNKRAIYGLLFKASAQTVATIAADPKRLSARVGMTSVLHTWGSALTPHPHDRPRRWTVPEWHSVAGMQAGVLYACPRAGAIVPAFIPGRPAGFAPGRTAELLR